MSTKYREGNGHGRSVRSTFRSGGNGTVTRHRWLSSPRSAASAAEELKFLVFFTGDVEDTKPRVA